MSISIRIIRN